MANMDYCKFENTLDNLRQCEAVFHETKGLSTNEAEARVKLIKLCVEIALDFGDEIGESVEYCDQNDE